MCGKEVDTIDMFYTVKFLIDWVNIAKKNEHSIDWENILRWQMNWLPSAKLFGERINRWRVLVNWIQPSSEINVQIETFYEYQLILSIYSGGSEKEEDSAIELTQCVIILTIVCSQNLIDAIQAFRLRLNFTLRSHIEWCVKMCVYFSLLE